ncbi:MAG: DUF4198 domain-containing protein [Acidobacteria bacterium]|nr:DUF4198 domain-containing protein [Acidobacteriota bacterium]
MIRRGVLAFFLALAPAALSAHDFWIEPSSFRPGVREDFTVALRVGEHFRGEPVPRDDRRIRRFFVVTNLGEAPVPGLPGTDPAGFARVESPAGAGSPMKFRLLYEDKPLAGALVKAICRDDPDKTVTARSGKDGGVSIRLPRRGVWLVEAVHMVAAPKGVDADWESIWTSVTFEIP